MAETTRKEQSYHFLQQPRRNATGRDRSGGGGLSWVGVGSHVPASCRVSEHPRLPESWAVLCGSTPRPPGMDDLAFELTWVESSSCFCQRPEHSLVRPGAAVRAGGDCRREAGPLRAPPRDTESGRSKRLSALSAKPPEPAPTPHQRSLHPTS